MNSLPNKIDNIKKFQKEWEYFKTPVIKNLQNMCSAINSRQGYQKTVGRNEEIHNSMQNKKQCWKTCLTCKNPNYYASKLTSHAKFKTVNKENGGKTPSVNTENI